MLHASHCMLYFRMYAVLHSPALYSITLARFATFYFNFFHQKSQVKIFECF